MQELANQPRHNGWRRSTALKTQFMSFIGFDMCAQGHGFSVQQLSDPEETSVSARLQLGLGFRGLLETPPWTGRALTWPLAARVPHILASWTRLALAARFWKAEGQYEESGPATSWRFLGLPGLPGASWASWGFLAGSAPCRPLFSRSRRSCGRPDAGAASHEVQFEVRSASSDAALRPPGHPRAAMALRRGASCSVRPMGDMVSDIRSPGPPSGVFMVATSKLANSIDITILISASAR